MRAAAIELSDLDTLEAESIHIIREVVAEFEHPVMLFSGGKDSVLMLYLARKAFAPAPVPFPIMHVDTGHNFPEVIEFRDRTVAELGLRLEVASVQEQIDAGRIKVAHPLESRNRHQTVALLEAIKNGGFDAVFGGGRRDEDKARAKERVLSFRDKFGQWDPKNQRPELWRLYNGRHQQGRAHPRLPDLPLDRARRLALPRARAGRPAADLLRPRARGGRGRGAADGRQRVLPAARGRRGATADGSLPDRRRRHRHRRRRVRPRPTTRP